MRCSVRAAERPVFLLGMPRSGTSWLSQIFEAHPDFCVRLSPNYSYPLKNRLGVESTAAEWVDVLASAAASDDPFMTQDWLRQTGAMPRFEKRGSARRLMIKDTRFHDVYEAGMHRLQHARCLYVVRHPCATLDSWRRSNEFPPGEDFERHWRTGDCRKHDGPGEYWGFDDWRRLTEHYLERQQHEPDRFFVFRYEDVVKHPQQAARQLFGFLGERIHPRVVEFIISSGSRHDPGTYSVFKEPSVVDLWKGSLPTSIANQIRRELIASRLAGLLE